MGKECVFCKKIMEKEEEYPVCPDCKEIPYLQVLALLKAEGY